MNLNNRKLNDFFLWSDFGALAVGAGVAYFSLYSTSRIALLLFILIQSIFVLTSIEFVPRTHWLSTGYALVTVLFWFCMSGLYADKIALTSSVYFLHIVTYLLIAKPFLASHGYIKDTNNVPIRNSRDIADTEAINKRK